MSGLCEKAWCRMVFSTPAAFCKRVLQNTRRVSADREIRILFYRLFREAGGSAHAEQGGRFEALPLCPYGCVVGKELGPQNCAPLLSAGYALHPGRRDSKP